MKPRRAGAAFVALLLLQCSAAAQVYYVTFKDPKQLKRFASCTITLPSGESAIVGEAKAGITLENGKINYQGEKKSNELWAVNVADPSIVPYKLDGTNYVNANVKNGVVSFTGSMVDKIDVLVPRQSLYGLAREYAIRKQRVDGSLKVRDANKAGTPGWSAAHARLLSEMERLKSWLESTVFPEAAKRTAAEIEKQTKTVAKEAYAQRLASAIASIKVVPTPERLVELGKKLAPDAQFHVQESRHLRITHDARLPDEQVKGLLDLGETMIDGFRADFVDPWLGEDFPDLILDECFMELWFGPDDLNAHEHFLTDWYGVSWGDHQAERVAAMSGRYRKSPAPGYLDYWKIADNKDFDAILAHQLGHVLANLHYNRDRRTDLPSWIEEGVGYWLALSYLGKNGVTCRQFEEAKDYAKPKGPAAAERSIFMGDSEIYTRLALERGAPCEQLLRKPLHQMEDADLAKAWSWFEWLGRDEGKKAQLWMRALCDVMAESGPSVAKFRDKSNEAFAVQNDDVFKVLDEKWKARAEKLQRTAAEPRKK